MRHQRRHRRVVLSAAIAVVALTATSAPSATSSSTAVRDGGIFRISLAVQAGLDNMDPALSFTAPGWALLDTVCARLMAYPDKRPPAGLRLQPEVAAAPPTVSRDLKTFTFKLRKGFRFSDGSPVRASAFARAINRTLAPSMKSPGALFTRHIVGAADVLAGKRRTATGVVARGDTLIVRFTRAAPDFPALTTLPFFCAVPPTLPVDAEGIGVFPTAGPYRVTEYRPGERVVIRRNPFYGGSRPHHVDGFDVDLRAPSPDEPIRRIERGEADWTTNLMPIFLNPALGLMAKYGINRSRFFSQRGLALRMFAFNSSRPLFRNNPALRRAVNFALDRQALQAIGGGPLAGRLTDQYIPPLVPGFRDGDVYPLERADQERARELARGNLRGGKAVFYTGDFAPPPRRRAAREAAACGDRARDRDQASAGAHRAARRTSTCSRSRVRSGTSHSWSGRRTCPTRRPISTSAAGHAITSAEPTSPASPRPPMTVRFGARRGCRRLASGSSPTAPWTCRLHATPRRSPRSASSTNRPSSPNASAASCCDRRSSSPPSA